MQIIRESGVTEIVQGVAVKTLTAILVTVILLMVTLLVAAAIIALAVRRYFYDRATGSTSTFGFLVYYSKYFLPQQVADDDNERTKRLKRNGNVSLFIFYFLLLDVILYSILRQPV